MKYADILRAQLDKLRAQLDPINETRAAALADMDAIAALMTTEQRTAATDTEETVLRAAEQAIADADAKAADLERQAADLERRIGELTDLEARMAHATSRRPPVPGVSKPEDIDALSARAADAVGAARTMVERSRIYGHETYRQSVASLLDSSDERLAEMAARYVLAMSTPEYFRAWAKAMTGRPLNYDDALAMDRAEQVQRAMSVGTTTAGGFAVPVVIDPTFIITGAGTANPFRRISTVKTLTDTYVWKGVTAGQVSASFDSEGVEVSDDAPTLAQPIVTTHMARAFIPFSFEAAQDIPNLAAELAVVIADAKDVLEGSKYAAGSGTGEPYGVVTAVGAVTASRVSATTGSTYAVADVYKVHQALPARHRWNNAANRAWVMNVQTINSTRQFATANNYHGFLTDLGGGQPSTLLGETLVEASSVTSTVTTGNDLMVFGDFRKFVIADRLGMTTELVSHLLSTTTNLPNGQRGALAWWRTGSNVVDVDAFRTLRL